MRIRHKGLCALHERDDAARLPTNLVQRLRRILFRLQEAAHSGSVHAPGFRLHPLKGDRAAQWSVRFSGNWRVVFLFEDGQAMDVDWNVTETAARLGCERGTLLRRLNSKAGVSANMALALEDIGWGTAEHWMRMQASYKQAQARRERTAAEGHTGEVLA